MDDVFVTVDLTETEYDAVVEWLGEEPINTGLGDLYDRLNALAKANEDDSQ